MVGGVEDPAVLDEPLMRDPRGRLVPVDWDTALGDLAEKLSLIRDSCEPYAIGLYTGTSQDTTARYAASRLMSGIGSPSTYTSTTVDSIAKILVPKLMAGRERLVPAVDFETTTLLLVIGENMVVSHGGFSYFPNPVWYLRKITGRGEVWVIDPRRTETARLAPHHLSTRSGTDFPAIASPSRALLPDGGEHERRRRTRPSWGPARRATGRSAASPASSRAQSCPPRSSRVFFGPCSSWAAIRWWPFRNQTGSPRRSAGCRCWRYGTSSGRPPQSRRVTSFPAPPPLDAPISSVPPRSRPRSP